jgi:large repetitive protein
VPVSVVSLLDIVRPYFFVGVDLGPGIHEVLELLHVDSHDVAWDDDGVVVTGVARIDSTNPSSPLFSPFAGGQKPNPYAQTPVWTFHDISIGFRLTVARRPAAALDTTTLTNAGLRAAIGALGSTTPASRSDAPDTQFNLDLLFNLVSVTIPKLKGGKLQGHLLVPDPAHEKVTLHLPRILLIVTQDSASETGFDVRLGSWGAETLDDADPAIASLIQMEPTYAIVNEHFGFGFEKAVLDLSATKTPPDLLEHFGIGDDFQGVFLPEVRIFATTEKTAGTAFNIGARDCIIGLNNPDDVEFWGDFNIDVDFIGAHLDVGLRLYGVDGSSHDPTKVEKASGDPDDLDRYQITVPSTGGPDTENYLLFVDVRSGAAPFVITAVSGEEHPADLSDHPDDAFFDDAANHPQDVSVLQRFRLFSTDQRVAIRVTSRNPGQRRVIVLDVYPDYQTQNTTQPDAAPKVKPAELLPPETGKVTKLREVEDLGVLLQLNPHDGALSVDGSVADVNSDGVARVTVDEGAERQLDVVWTTTGDETLAQVKAYFEFDHPTLSEGTARISGQPITGTAVTALHTTEFKHSFDERSTAPGAPAPIVRVDAYASYEGELNIAHNTALAGRRANQLAGRIAQDLGIPVGDIVTGVWGENQHPLLGPPVPDERLVRGQVPGDESADAAGADSATYHREEFRVAVATLLAPTSGTDTFAGQLKRPARDEVNQPEKVPDPPPPKSQQPRFLRSVGGTVRLERDRVSAFELRMSVDVQTAHEDGLDHFRDNIDSMRPGLESAEEGRLPDGSPNPEDGVVDLRYTITHDLAAGGYTHTLVGRAGAGDVDGLWSWGQIPAADAPGEPATEAWRDVLGLYFALAPLAAPAAPNAPPDGSVVPLVVALTTPLVVTTLGLAHVLRIVHCGVELIVRYDEDEMHGALFFDVESDIWLDVRIGSFVIVTTRPDKPIKVRYRAVGFALDAVDDHPVQFRPAFDSSQGYTIDLADSGSLRVLPALGSAADDLIQILGARIARTNPLNVEVDLGLGVDLGVFTVDKFGVRVPIDPAGPPTITAIGVGVDIPDTLTGGGYLQIFEDGFAGSLDLRLPSVGLRVSAALSARTVTEGDRSALGMIAALSAEFPGGIPVGGTGLAIFGFAGLFAMHQHRLENASARIPALDWLANVAQGNPMRLQAWGPALDAWAFGIGLVAGTLEGGTILNLKGMLVLELPGPRVLVLANANLLKRRPPTLGTETGNLFAVIDVSPEHVLIGMQIDYVISHVLEVHIPADAGFFVEPPEHYFLDVGTMASPATAKVLDVFDATGYLEVRGDGIPDFPLVPGGLQGFSLATGFALSLLWGSTSAGLYVRATAGFDAGVGFTPFRFAGRVFLDGKLRLFIVSLSVHAELDLDSDGVDTRIEGEVCGKVEFFFFSVSGCVHFALGNVPGAPFPPLPIRDLSLQSRSPALVEGTATDRGVDTVLCRGTADGSVPVVDDGEGGQRQVFVPIDSIPLLQLEAAPLMDSSAVDGVLSGSVGGGAGWRQRGPNFVRYTISSVRLELVRLNGAPPSPGTTPTTDGPRPYTWRQGPQPTGGDAMPVDLAILDWRPTNVDKALLESPGLDTSVDEGWGHVCDPVAIPARVLWTFRDSALGPSEAGWRLTGEAWPDLPGALRSRPVDTRVRGLETWRTGSLVDGLLPNAPAQVLGAGVQCPRLPTGAPTHGGPGGILDPRPALSVAAADFRRIDVAPPSRRPELVLVADGVLAAAAVAPGAAAQPLPPAAEGGMAPVLGEATNRRRCVAKLLEAPYEQPAEALAESTLPSTLVEAIRAIDEARKTDLRDVVRVAGGPFVELRLLIYAHPKMAEKGLLQVRATAPGGAAMASVTAHFTHITDSSQLPPTWRDLTGPWWDDVELARSYVRSGVDKVLNEYLVTVKLPAPALHVEIGVTPLRTAIDGFGMTKPSYLVAVVEGLSLAEVDRADEDGDQAAGDAGGLTGTLTGQGHALLRPGGEYRITVDYDAEIGARRPHPDENEDPNEIVVLRSETGQQDARTFFTDSQPPRSLDPWLLAQQPSDGERFHFYDEPVVVVFATNDVLELFGAYGRTLRAVARAASFRGSAGTPEEAGNRFDLEGVFVPLGGLVFSPWETTVRRRLGTLPCVEADPDADTHGRATLPFDLDPLTDYLLDVEALLPNGTRPPASPLPGEVGTRPLYRRAFTTGRYATRAALAEDVRIAAQRSLLVPAAAALAALPDGVVSDEAFDAALQQAGLPLDGPVDEPVVAKLWAGESPAVPVAVLIHAPEPLWRTRVEPTAERDASGEHIERWRMQPAEWLGVTELIPDGVTPPSAGGRFVQAISGVMTTIAPTPTQARRNMLHPPVPPLPLPPQPSAVTTRLVHDASGTRTLAFVAPDATGLTLTLGLRRTLNPLLDADASDTPLVLAEVTLSTPPWEGDA